jgi:tetratricopeptide (TPR) repeat protein
MVTALGLALGLAVALSTAPGLAASETAPPSPLTGPGVAELGKGERKKIDRASRELAAGDIAESRKRLGRAGSSTAARLLGFQIDMADGGLEALDELLELCERDPGYAAAWLTLSVAAERAGAEATAIDAARVGAELWPDSSWRSRPDELRRRWVDDRIARAADLLADDRPDEALVELDAARVIEPVRPDADLVRARVLLATGASAEAEEILAGLPDLDDAVLLRATIAEQRGDWQTAMEAYASLPADHPTRAAALQRAQWRWRLTLLPAHARAAMESARVSRAELAVILVSVHPRLTTLPGGPVPVMSDIVDHPGQREIIIAVRLGIVRPDLRERRFYPDLDAEPATIREAVEHTRTLVGLTAPVWCSDPGMLGSSCTTIPEPPGGEAVVAAVAETMPGAGR